MAFVLLSRASRRPGGVGPLWKRFTRPSRITLKCARYAPYGPMRADQRAYARSPTHELTPCLISVRKPHKPVKPAAIAHWLKAVMKLAGIDTDKFSAHSTRGASTSKAKQVGVSTTDILKAANWTTASTFCRFYHRPINSGKFGSSVLK